MDAAPISREMTILLLSSLVNPFTRETVDFEKIQQDVNNGTIEDWDDLYDENGKFFTSIHKERNH